MDRKKIFLASLGHLSCDVSSGSLPAILPFLSANYGLSYQAAAGLMFAYSCVSSVIQPVFGYLSDRLSKPWFIPVGVLLAGSGIAAIGMLHHYWAIFAAVMVSGLGAALFHPEGARYANKVSGASKGTGLSLFSMGGNTGFVVGPLLAAAAIGFFGLPGTLVFGVITLIMTPVLFRQVADMNKPGQVVPRVAAGESGEDSAERGRNDWKEFSKLTVTLVCRSILFMGFNTFIPLYWVHVFGRSETEGAVALAFFCTFGVISNFIGGLLSDRFGYTQMIRISQVLLIPTVPAFALAEGGLAAFALLLPLGFALYASFSSMVVLGQKYLAKNIGFASGVTFGLSTSMGGIAAPLLGRIADIWGLPAAIWSLSSVAVLGTIFAFRLAAVRGGLDA